MKTLRGGITSPKGFLAGAVSCGIKRSGRPDLALLFSKSPCVCVGTFTTNRFRSGSVVLAEEVIRKGRPLQALIVNSGNANCCIGEKELIYAKKITGLTAKGLGLNKDQVLIASTGIIGRPLPLDKIRKKIRPLIDALKPSGANRFAKAIMTTDTVHKEIAVEIKIGKNKVRIAGAAKGSGMISPNMATMLAFFTTDALVEKAALRSAFKECVSGSFNKITVDGDMSTNDTAIILANGLAGNTPIKRNSGPYLRFLNALRFISTELAKRIVLDGEGSTRFVEVIVKGAKDAGQAETIARHVAGSSLVKTMVAGGDPNWGRVAASIGSSGVTVKVNRVDIYFGKRLVMKNGVAARVSRSRLLDIFKKKEIFITIDVKSGKGHSNE